jgi:hypothetical protein
VVQSDTFGIDALVGIEPPILLHRTIAGRSYDVRIGGRPMTLTLPSEGLDSIVLSTGRADPPSRTFPEPPLADGFTRGARMHLRSTTPVPKQVLALDAVRLRCNDREFAETLGHVGDPDLSEAVGDWLDIVRDWLAAWSRNPRSHAERRSRPSVLAALIDHPDRGPIGLGGPMPVVVLGGERASTPSEWKAAITAASRGDALPLPHRLLAEAIVHAFRAESRHAVISACGAAEVALADAARGRLADAGHSDRQITEILKTVAGVVDLYRLNATQGTLKVSFGATLSQLAGPRNLAAHDGKTPDDRTVRRAIKTAKALLDVSPLPEPGEFA